MPQTVHGNRRYALRTQSHPVAQVVARNAPDVLVKEGDERAPTLAHARLRLIPDGLVHGDAYPRGNA